MKTLTTSSKIVARALVLTWLIMLAAATNITWAQDSQQKEEKLQDRALPFGLHKPDGNSFHLLGKNNDLSRLQGLKSGSPVMLNVNGGDALIHGITVGRGSFPSEYNTAFGKYTLMDNISGVGNTAMGYGSLAFNETGHANTSIGAYALVINNTGNENTALGALSMYSNNSGSSNTAVGTESLFHNLFGNENVAIGKNALLHLHGGDGNTAVGHRAGRLPEEMILLKGSEFDEMSNGTFVGSYAAPAWANMENVTGIGHGAMPFVNNQVMIGNMDVAWIGGYAEWTEYFPLLLKSDPKENVAGLDFILKLRPVTFETDTEALKTHLANKRQQSDGNQLHNHAMSHDLDAMSGSTVKEKTGFLPEEVMKAAREAEFEFTGITMPDQDLGIYGIRYGQFVMPIVKSIQELNDKIEEVLPENLEQLNLVLASQQEEIALLKTRNAYLEQRLDEIMGLLSSHGLDSNPVEGANPRVNNNRNRANESANNANARLEQNTPNPFGESTVIRYFLPEGTTNARIVISDMNGNRIRTAALTEPGHGQLSLSAGSLTSGTYIYTLYVGNRLIDSKRMVIL